MDQVTAQPIPPRARERRWAQSLSSPTARHTLLLLALATACVAQWLLDDRASLALALPLLLVGGLAFALGARRMSLESPAQAPSVAPMVRTPVLVWAAILAALSFASLRGNKFTAQGAGAWVLGMILCLAALRAERSGGRSTHRPWQVLFRSGVRLSWPAAGLVLALVIGIALRFFDLRALPADLGWDLPYNSTDGARILRGEHLIFFPDNYGREGMFFYLIAAVSRLVPLSPYSIRVTSALVGVAAIPAIYLLARECYDAEAGAYAALFLAMNRWHISLTRSGYRVSLMPLFCILALYGAARVLRRGQARDWALAGLILGLGLWTYKAFVFGVVTVLGALFLYALLGRQRRPGITPSADSAVDPVPAAGLSLWPQDRRRGLVAIAVILLVMVIAAIPMVRVVVDMPQAYLAREELGSRLVSESLTREGKTPVQLYLRSTGVSLLMFNYKGDANERFAVPAQRHLGYVTGVLLVFGVGLALARLRKGGNGLLLLALPGLIAPQTISMLWGELPNCFRSSGVIGPSLVLAALVLRALRGHLSEVLRGWRLPQLELRLSTAAGQPRTRVLSLSSGILWIPILIVALAFGMELRETSRAYFTDFRRVAPRIQNYSMALTMAEQMIAFDSGPAVIKSWPHWYDGRAVQAHLAAAGRRWDGEYHQLSPNEAPLAGFHGQMLVLMHPEDRQALTILQAYFPRWSITLDHYPNGEPSLLAFYGAR